MIHTFLRQYNDVTRFRARPFANAVLCTDAELVGCRCFQIIEEYPAVVGRYVRELRDPVQRNIGQWSYRARRELKNWND